MPPLNIKDTLNYKLDQTHNTNKNRGELRKKYP